MEIDDIVTSQGRRYLLRGFTRAGSTEQHVVLQDEETGEYQTVPASEVEPAPA